MIKRAFPFIVWVAFLFNSCSSDSQEEVQPDQPIDDIYFNFTLKGTSYEVSRANYTLANDGHKFACAQDHVTGAIGLSLQNPDDTGFIEEINFRIAKKVFKDELDPANSLSYLTRVVHSPGIGFPIPTSGFYKTYDLENNVFEVDRNVSAEAYLSINTKDHLYRSNSIVPNERDPNSFIRIEKVIENSGQDSYDYPYIIEGVFKVNLFEGMYGTTSQMVEGNFRWPVGRVEDLQVLSICK
jgi:hypothetical protein